MPDEPYEYKPTEHANIAPERPSASSPPPIRSSVPSMSCRSPASTAAAFPFLRPMRRSRNASGDLYRPAADTVATTLRRSSGLRLAGFALAGAAVAVGVPFQIGGFAGAAAVVAAGGTLAAAIAAMILVAPLRAGSAHFLRSRSHAITPKAFAINWRKAVWFCGQHAERNVGKARARWDHGLASYSRKIMPTVTP